MQWEIRNAANSEIHRYYKLLCDKFGYLRLMIAAECGAEVSSVMIVRSGSGI